jgi:hypothetical protein
MVLASGVGVSGLLLVKSILQRPIHLLIPHAYAPISGDIPVSLPYAIDAQLWALEALEQGAAICFDTTVIEPGFLVNQTGTAVVPVSICWENEGSGQCEVWQGTPPAPRSRVHVYFGNGERSGAVSPPAAGVVLANRFATERVRQILQDHQQMVLHRLGGRAAQ